MFDERVDHVVVLVRMLFQFVDDDYDLLPVVVYRKNEKKTTKQEEE